MRRSALGPFGLALVLVLLPAALRAEVTRIDIATRTDVLGGKAFGDAGAYEKLVGKVFFAVEPQHARNKIIADIDKAPRNARGQVEFSADLYVLRPKIAARGNGVAVFDVLNRGTKFLLQRFNRAGDQPSSPGPGALDLDAEADYGDGFLLRRGFTLVWIGWQFDVHQQQGMMGLDAPVATDQGKLITGMVTTLFTVGKGGPEIALADVHYQPADSQHAENTLITRDAYYTMRTIPRTDWQFARTTTGKRPEVTLSLRTGFKPGVMYELTYRAQAPTVAGLGLAVFRDLASAMKYQPGAAVSAKHAYVYGASQSGRFLQEFLYGGFNADERDRKAFDGVIADVGGAARGSFNERFATPASLTLYTGTRFPFTELPQRDPVSGKTDGLLTRTPQAAWPIVFHTYSGSDYWGGGRAAALTHTSLDGKEDARIPDNVRMYYISGTQHLPGELPAKIRDGQQKNNPNDGRFALRGLLIAMDRWVREGVAAPPSRYPRLSDGTLTLQQNLAFPAIPGVRSPLTIPGPYRGDLTGPQTAHLLPFLVPQVDVDGNDRAGIRLPDHVVPLATYTGWNFRNPATGPETEALSLSGSSIPFAPSRAVRTERKDRRLSIEERYPSRAAYEKQISDAAQQLIRDRYIVAEDLPTLVSRAMQQWDAVMRSRTSSQD
jgi:hypothetical protein